MNNKKLDEHRRMLEGNLVRMRLTDSLDELSDSYSWARYRLEEIFRIRYEQLRGKLNGDEEDRG